MKVKGSAEQEEAKRQERERRLEQYQSCAQRARSKRQDGELDQEALDLTAEVLIINPDLGTFWNFRREVLLKMEQEKSVSERGLLFGGELSFLERCLRVNPKSYGTWHQRVWALRRHPDPDWRHELQLCTQCLQQDGRNFHCWDHRRVVVREGRLPVEEELDFTQRLINTNFSNYSAWHYRSTVLPLVHPHPSLARQPSPLALTHECELVQNAVFTDPNDQSAWFYHRWLLGRADRDESISCLFVDFIDQRVAVVFTRPVHVPADGAGLVLRVDNRPLPLSWRPPHGGKHSPVWVCELPTGTLNVEFPDQTVRVTWGQDGGSMECCCTDRLRGEGWCRDSATDQQLFQGDLSVQRAAVLEAELASCKQLLELEPDNKWCLLTVLLLLWALGPLEGETECLGALGRLSGCDPLRAAHVADLRSRLLLQNAVLRMEYAQARVVTLAHKGLTTLCHLDQLLLITHLDLSGNPLRKLPPTLRTLLCLQVLQADDCSLEGIEGVSALPKLQEISLRGNLLSDLSDLRPLTLCLRLESANLSGNPVCGGEGGAASVRALLPLPLDLLT